MCISITEALRSHQVNQRKYILVSVACSRDRPKPLVKFLSDKSPRSMLCSNIYL